MDDATLVKRLRADAGLSVRALADAAGVAASTVHRIERGQLRPTTETLRIIAEAAGARLTMGADVDYAVSLVGLARSILEEVARDDYTTPIRQAAELASRFEKADADQRRRMIAAPPPSTGDERWDVFLGALGEWLAVRAGMRAPEWVHRRDRYLDRGWWVTPMASMRAWDYAGSPAAFKTRGIYLHRDSLANV
jgi:transcriptional regulator with XRE-family HTH domain